jgi:hypothetical protein
MQIDVSQDGREDRSLRHAFVGSGKLLSVQHPNMQTLSDKPQKRLVCCPLLEHFQQHRAIDTVEKACYVRLQDHVPFSPAYLPVQFLQRVMGFSLPPETM